MQRETKKSGLARSVSLKGVRKAANSLKKATVDIVDKVGDKVGDIGHADLDISERTATAMAISGMSIKLGSQTICGMRFTNSLPYTRKLPRKLPWVLCTFIGYIILKTFKRENRRSSVISKLK